MHNRESELLETCKDVLHALENAGDAIQDTIWIQTSIGETVFDRLDDVIQKSDPSIKYDRTAGETFTEAMEARNE